MFVSFFKSDVFHEIKKPKTLSRYPDGLAAVTYCGHFWGKPESGGDWIDAYGNPLIYSERAQDGKRICQSCVRAKANQNSTRPA